MSVCYLIHLERPFQHAQHYIGWAEYFEKRIQHHRKGTGAVFLRYVNDAHIKWEVVRLWHDKDKHFERQLKNQNHAARLCPICNPQGWTRRMAATAIDFDIEAATATGS